MTTTIPTPVSRILGYGVHLLTSCGMVTAFLAMVAIGKGDYKEALSWLLLYLVIDGIDGTFARKLKVKENLPTMDGAVIDDLSDFANFVFVPCWLLYECGLMATPFNFIAVIIIILSSAIYYGKGKVVTDDNYFLGFTGMWNVVLFFLICVFDFSEIINFVLLISLAIMQYLPIKFIYPSKPSKFRWLHIVVSVAMLIGFGGVLFEYPKEVLIFKYLAIAGLAYFALMSIPATIKSFSK